MSGLPTGTVSLLFSDIEGSTALLKRLGPVYAEALDGQRKVLRKAWAEHGGTELGTEGDSFFVVFPTAEGAVAAATQAQRELDEFDWPGGEQVRVRMGVHTGTPNVHDGGYVGMDVHRAARVAGSAHGGQVLVSAATAGLVTDCLPDGVTLRDLGSHRLKDITNAERLYQLVIPGLLAEFPPAKTLGAATSLPRPVTPLVGRNGELAELAALLSSSDARLVTLTGPGGSGKSRLAIAVARELVERFPDGVYFVPLATVTNADGMWATIAEVLDVPPESRIPPAFFAHVARRSALFVLDNLEQVNGAGLVVSDLLREADQAIVIATSRRPLNVAGEYLHPVPPLELPEAPTVEAAEKSGAVHLFVQAAQRARASFTLSSANAADVVAVCRSLDGLPLALELAAARTRLLSPAALLARLDHALEIKDPSVDRPSRQRTLRETISWSYDLLDPLQRTLFARLGVFSGGADLDAIDAVCGDVLNGRDALDAVADLVDASLVVLRDDEVGEPRVAMLETIGAFALERLHDGGDFRTADSAHADYFLQYVRQLGKPNVTPMEVIRAGFERERANIHAALQRALDDPGIDESDGARRRRTAIGLCADLWWIWGDGEYAEGRRWLQAAIDSAEGEETTELGGCLIGLARIAADQGDLQAARESAWRSVDVLRRLGHKDRPLTSALRAVAVVELRGGDLAKTRAAIEEELAVADESGDPRLRADALADMGTTEFHGANYQQAATMLEQAIEAYKELGDNYGAVSNQLVLANTLEKMGELDEAARRMHDAIPRMLSDVGSVSWVLAIAESYAHVLAKQGDLSGGLELLAAADALRERNHLSRDAAENAEASETLTLTQSALSPDQWNKHYQHGRDLTLNQALTAAHARKK